LDHRSSQIDNKVLPEKNRSRDKVFEDAASNKEKEGCICRDLE